MPSERMPRRQRTSERALAAFALVLVASLVAAPARAEQAGAAGITPEQGRQVFRQALRTARRIRPEPVGLLRLHSLTDVFTTYLVEVSDDHSPRRPPTEIRVTKQRHGRSTVLYEKREQDTFLYMFPLDLDETLLATVWETGTAPVVRVFRIWGNNVKLVMYDGGNATPQFVEGAGIVLLGTGRVMHGNVILPTHAQIWQWDVSEGKFVLRATVPYKQRWNEITKLLERPVSRAGAAP